MKINSKNQIFKDEIKKYIYKKKIKKIQDQPVLTFKSPGLIKKINE